MNVKKTIISLLLFTFFALSSFAQEKYIHVVILGETLYSISKTLDVSVSELRSWNNLSSDDLAIGQELAYFKIFEEYDLNQELGESLIKISAPLENEFYTVKSGENLTNIAQTHNMTLNELRTLNNISGDLLRIGQKLVVRKAVDSIAPSASEYYDGNAPQGSFVIYSVTSDDNLDLILSNFKMSAYELQQLNPEVNIHSLDSNQRITVLFPPSSNFENPYKVSSNLQDLGLFTTTSYTVNETGNTTTSGELYNPNQLTAAHSNIKIGSVLYIENPDNGFGIYIRVNDRITETGLKLSSTAFRLLSFSNTINPSVRIYTEN